MATSLELLQNCYLFKELTPDELTKIGPAIKIETFAAGGEVFAQGADAKALYLIKEGSVRVGQKGTTGDLIEVTVLGPGSHFGEMAFLDGEKRSATVEAIDKSEIYRIDYDSLKKILQQNPVMAVRMYRSLALFLCGRLRVTTNDLSFAREQNLKLF